MPVLVRIAAIAVDPTSNTPVIILRDAEERYSIPIWVGVLEASAIHLHLEGAELPRPMTHDLMKSMMEQLGARVTSVLISDLRDNTFFAEIHLARGDGEIVIDSRPSDAIAIAIRCDAPIYVADEVARQAHRDELKGKLEGGESTADPHASPGTDTSGPVQEILDLLEKGVEPKWKA